MWTETANLSNKVSPSDEEDNSSVISCYFISTYYKETQMKANITDVIWTHKQSK